MSNRRNILLVQLPIPPLGPEPIRGNVPLAAGYLKLYAEQQGLGRDYDIEIMPAEVANKLGDQALVSALCSRAPWLLGFTCYLWNIDRTLWVAEQVKRRCPATKIIVGGPEITRDNEWVLRSPCIDYAVVGEGEQTFSELLASYARNDPLRPATGGRPPAVLGQDRAGGGPIAGLLKRSGSEMIGGPPRLPMPQLDRISSPYLAGILNAGDQEQLLLETIRGCIFKCKFCYYPKAYDGLYYVSKEKILANLAHARDHGAKEVYLLDPTLNQRRDFTDFLQILKQGNPDGRLEYYAELRAEGITATHARLMRESNFKEVEIGLQSIDPKTQDLMERRNNLKAFEKGLHAIQAEGIRVKVDLIVGLPGDTVDSVRRGMHYLADNRLYDDIQVFQLSILPGTSFRTEADQLGLVYQPRPPYYVLQTPTLTLDDMLGLLEESEDVFDTEFDPLPKPILEFGASDQPTVFHVDLDRAGPAGRPPIETAQAFTLWFKTSDAYRSLARSTAVVQHMVQQNPFSTLQIVLETNAPFPFDVFKALRTACATDENVYLDRFYEFTPGRSAGARRIVVATDDQSNFPADWLADAEEHCDMLPLAKSKNASPNYELNRH